MNTLPPDSANRYDASARRQIVHIDLRLLNAKRVKEMAKRGNASIQILGASGQDCPACAQLDGEVFPVRHLPLIPPADCSCLPYCTCILTVISNENQAPVN